MLNGFWSFKPSCNKSGNRRGEEHGGYQTLHCFRTRQMSAQL